MKTYKIVAVPTDKQCQCVGCIFEIRYEENGCSEPEELNCYKNIWVLEEIDYPNVPEENLE